MTAKTAPQKMNPLAAELNARLETKAPEVLEMLSEYGKRLYFPKGILSQSAEAKEKAHRFNATIGIATEDAGPMYLESVHTHLAGIEPKDAYPYAPPAGRPALREAWRQKLLEENPSMRARRFGLPIATSAITHGLKLAAELFTDPGDVLLLPDKLWGNYRLAFECHLGAEVQTYAFYTEDGSGFDVEAFARALEKGAAERDKLIVLLNFPNNPTGYMPTEEEGEAIARALEARAAAGTKLVVITDDAYFGLFYHLDRPSMTESLFGRLTGRHPNLLAVKLDGATKELFVWGLRCGFITYGPGREETADEVLEVLDAKTRGAIRGGISNVPMLSQTLIEKALDSAEITAERQEKCDTLRARAEQVHAVVNAPRFRESWDVYPFNSGYFMCVRVKDVDAERVRLHLLDEYGVGLIATSATDLRVAFSCLEKGDVEELFEILHKAIQELR